MSKCHSISKYWCVNDTIIFDWVAVKVAYKFLKNKTTIIANKIVVLIDAQLIKFFQKLCWYLACNLLSKFIHLLYRNAAEDWAFRISFWYEEIVWFRQYLKTLVVFNFSHCHSYLFLDEWCNFSIGIFESNI